MEKSRRKRGKKDTILSYIQSIRGGEGERERKV
jgi:hypothetical protein